MKLIFPNPELQWRLSGNYWFLNLAEGDSAYYVGIISVSKSIYRWHAYSFLNFSNHDIGRGESNTLEEAKKKVEETLIFAGVAK